MSVASEIELAEWDGVLIPERVRNRGSVTLSLNAALRAHKPLRPGVYLRISHDRFGNEKGVTRQLEDANWKRTDLGWGPFAKVYKENDTGAYKKRKVARPDGSVEWEVIRPEFRQMLKDLLDGVIDGIIFYDQDRLVRQPRDLEDLIDVIEFKGRPTAARTTPRPPRRASAELPGAKRDHGAGEEDAAFARHRPSAGTSAAHS
ncbi:hypothetical protein ABH926_001989 [Catenulispora sp. GP43]|uniref:recombinase family protein n=1 Tax=Catenulispora sp. GP43 TaxID=3156263 RepID=UPI00351365A7